MTPPCAGRPDKINQVHPMAWPIPWDGSFRSPPASSTHIPHASCPHCLTPAWPTLSHAMQMLQPAGIVDWVLSEAEETAMWAHADQPDKEWPLWK